MRRCFNDMSCLTLLAFENELDASDSGKYEAIDIYISGVRRECHLERVIDQSWPRYDIMELARLFDSERNPYCLQYGILMIALGNSPHLETLLARRQKHVQVSGAEECRR